MQAAMVALQNDYEEVNCSATDGSFTIPMHFRWPAPYHFLDSGIAQLLLTLGAASIIDVGAGSGQYGAWLETRRRRGEANVPAWRGVDGATNIEQFTRTKGAPGAAVRYANVCDARVDLGAPAEWAMSLEVGEHLPESCLGTYTRLLARSATRGLLLSWAHPGQGGHCHISTRSGEWVKATFGRFGWALDAELTARARNASKLGWLRRNIMAFRPGAPVSTSSALSRLFG